jgi:hypothetical protein
MGTALAASAPRDKISNAIVWAKLSGECLKLDDPGVAASFNIAGYPKLEPLPDYGTYRSDMARPGH